MHEGSRRWKAAALVLIGLETAALFWAYYALDLGEWVRGLGSDGTMLGILAQIPAAAHALFPHELVSAVGGFVASSGVSGPLRELAVRSAALGSGLGASSLGSAVVAPAYFAARRLLRHAPARGRGRKVGPRRAAGPKPKARHQRDSVHRTRRPHANPRVAGTARRSQPSA